MTQKAVEITVDQRGSLVMCRLRRTFEWLYLAWETFENVSGLFFDDLHA